MSRKDEEKEAKKKGNLRLKEMWLKGPKPFPSENKVLKQRSMNDAHGPPKGSQPTAGRAPLCAPRSTRWELEKVTGRSR